MAWQAGDHDLAAAEDGGLVVGHALLSRMDAPFRALGLAPVAVMPGRQRRGIGSRLVSRSLADARDDKWTAVFVLGDPRYYERFGFAVEPASRFACRYVGPHFMMLVLDRPRPEPTGRLDDAPAFAALG